MKNAIYTYVLVAGLALFSFVGSANAVVTDSPYQNLGLLTAGQEDTFYIDRTKVADSLVTAFLPSYSAITFTYTFDGDLLGGVLGAGGVYSYVDGGVQHQGFAAASSNMPFNFAGSMVGGVALDTALASASADIDPKGSTATATIINGSGGVLNIASSLFAYLGNTQKYTISYKVTETPLPAALPMFAFGLCAVAGVRKRKKTAA